jgi:hypothetical protein
MKQGDSMPQVKPMQVAGGRASVDGRDGRLGRPLALLFVAALTACAGGESRDPVDPDPPDEPGSGYTLVACPSFQLATGTGLPLDEIEIGALPASFNLPAAVVVSVEGTDPAGLAHLISDAEGTLRVLVPLHPSGGLVGGPVTLTVTDGTRACAPVEFTIAPLPAAEGELAAVVDLLQAVLDEQAEAFGATREQLRTVSLADLPDALWPLALAQAALDDPASGLSLRAVAEGAEGLDVRDYVDRILARTGVRAALTSSDDHGSVSRGRAPGGARASAFGCLPDVVGSSAALLDDCMRAAASAKASADGISKRVADDIVKAFGVAGEHGLPVAEAVQTAFALTFWVIYTEREKAAALYPSRFTSMQLSVDRDRFFEDQDAHGRVSHAAVYATNDGYNLQEEILGAVDQARTLAKQTGKFDFSTGTDADAVAGMLLPKIEARLREMRIEALDIPAELFGPVNVTEPAWIQARIAAGDAVAMVDETVYEPRAWGVATLSVRTRDGAFGGQQISDATDIRVEILKLTVSPDRIHLRAGEPQGFTVSVIDSRYPEMVERDASVVLQGTVQGIEYVGEGLHIVDYTAPAEPDPTRPDLLVVRHTATTGARAYSTEERLTIAEIRFEPLSLTISPRYACLEAGDSLAFTAVVRGVEDPTVTWSASAHSISGDGVYTAPSGLAPGTSVAITATSVVDSDLTDTVNITVGGCRCSYDATLAGNTSAQSQGPAQYRVSAEGLLTVRLEGAGESTIGDRIFVGLSTAPGWPGTPGDFEIARATWAHIGTPDGAEFWPEAGLTCTSCGGLISVETVTDEMITGSISAVLPSGLPSEELPPTVVTATFRAALHDGLFSPWSNCANKWEGS